MFFYLIVLLVACNGACFAFIYHDDYGEITEIIYMMKIYKPYKPDLFVSKA